MNAPSQRLFCFGLGYSARALIRALDADRWSVAGTYRSPGSSAQLARHPVEAFPFDRDRPLADAAGILAGTTHLLVSIPPDAEGDPVLDCHAADIAACETLRWVGYLSTTGVYGDTGGARVDEDSPLRPTSERSRRRVAAETGWRRMESRRDLPVHVFRLAGIYGPGRSALDQVRDGRARRIDRPGHLFSRIHVDDIANVLLTSMAKPRPGAVYNLADDEPAAPAEVVDEACRLLGVAPPPLVPFELAAKSMSQMARSFWQDNRRVDNRRVKRELGVKLLYPDYRRGLAAILRAERGA